MNPGRKRNRYVLRIPPQTLMSTKVASIKYLDVTHDVNRIIDRLGIRNGIVSIQIQHTTAALTCLCVQENEPGLIEEDLPKFLSALVPEHQAFAHDREERIAALGGAEPRNAKSHLFASLFPTSVQLNVHDYQLDRGTWQSVLLLDFDPENRPERKLSIVVTERI